MRYIIAIIGYSLIVIRIIFPEWKIDNLTLIIFFLSSFLLLIDSKKIDFGNIRRIFESIKIGNILDVKFRELNKELEAVEESTSVEAKGSERDYDFLQASGSGSYYSPNIEPEYEIVTIAQEIESFISAIWFLSLKNTKKCLSIKSTFFQHFSCRI